MYVVRHEFSDTQESGLIQEALSVILLRSLDETFHLVRFDTFEENMAGGRLR